MQLGFKNIINMFMNIEPIIIKYKLKGTIGFKNTLNVQNYSITCEIDCCKIY